MAVSEDMPCVASMLSSSVLRKQQGGHQSRKTEVHMFHIVCYILTSSCDYFLTETRKEEHITHINTVVGALLFHGGE